MSGPLQDPWRTLLDLGLGEWLHQRSGLSASALEEDMARTLVAGRLSKRGLTPAEYWTLIQRDQSEAQALLEALLIRETRFYRDRAPFRHLSRVALRRRRPIRALSLPCASGEEAVSIAIALHQGGLTWQDITVVGVDLSHQAVETARRGVYSRRAVQDLPDPLGELYFRCRGMSCEVLPQLRACIQYRQGNLFQLPDLGEPFDVIFCRNLFIYCDAQDRQRGLAILKERLRPDGLLYLGHAEQGGWLEAYFRPLGEPASLAWVPHRHLPCEHEARSLPPVVSPGPLPARPQPHHPAARRLREAQRLYRQGRLRAAMETLRGVIYLYPRHWNALDLMARWAERAGDREYALRYRRWAERVRRRNEMGGR